MLLQWDRPLLLLTAVPLLMLKIRAKWWRGRVLESITRSSTDSVFLNKLFNLSGCLSDIQVSLYFGPAYCFSLSSHLDSTYPLNPPVKEAYFPFQEHVSCSLASSFTRLLFLSWPLKFYASFKAHVRGCFLHKAFFSLGCELPHHFFEGLLITFYMVLEFLLTCSVTISRL